MSTITASVPQFLHDCARDLSSERKVPPARMAQFKNLVCSMEELLESDRAAAQKFKKSVKSLHNSSQCLVTDQLQYAENMERLGSIALSREAETGIGTAFLKLSVITKDLANHKKVLCENFNNMVLFPLNSLLKVDMNKLNDLKKPFDESWKEYKAKGIKKEARKKTSEIVLYRLEPLEGTDESDRERRTFMYSACEYMVKTNEIKTKKGVELVQHLIEYYHSQLRYFSRGVELLESMRGYFEGLTGELQQLRSLQDAEKKELVEIRNQLKAALQLDKDEAAQNDRKVAASYQLHQASGDKAHGAERCGYLQKRSEGVRKQWQKRYCVVKDGLFTLAHSPKSPTSATLNLLTCQVKPAPDQKDGKKLAFALVAHNRTYLFQTDDEADHDAWVSVLNNAREEALQKAFGESDGSLSKEPVSSIQELTQGIISEVKRLPGNNQCVDCNANDPSWLSTNLGILVCIECSGIHRDLGVHVSRIRSLTLDRLGTAELLLARAVGNSGFNEIMEADLDPNMKPTPGSTMEVRKDFIQKKYVHRAFMHPSGNPTNVLVEELVQAINYHDILAILQLYADGLDLGVSIPGYRNKGTALHYAVENEDLTSLHVVDFIIQNSNNVDVLDTNGNTPLHIAAMLGKLECLKLLLRGGAKFDLVNRDGKTPMALAMESNQTEIVSLLKDAANGALVKCDHVKIDWGIVENEDIYENPLDMTVLKLELKDELLNMESSKNPPVLGGLSTPGPVHRAQTTPKGGVKTSGLSTPSAPLTATPTARHSVAGVQVYPPGAEKLWNQPGADVAQGPAPPPPPSRKGYRLKPPPSTSSQDGSSPPSAPISPDSGVAAGAGVAGTTVLSTFAPRLGSKLSASSLPSFPASGPAVEKSSSSKEPPPAPPARTTSSTPRMTADVATLPRPDRPPPPTPDIRGHSRGASEGNILQQDIMAAIARDRTESMPATGLLYQRSLSDDPPPLPPPRPRGKDDRELDAGLVMNANVSGHSRVPSLFKRSDSKPKFRRAKALYDCEADHSDELSFAEGEIIIIKKEADPEWWFGEIENEPERCGVFPISFVHVLNE